MKYVSGHNRRGKGERVFFKNQGRWYVTTRNCHKHIAWSHVVMWNMIGRPVARGEEVLHIDGNSENDEPTNLRLYESHAEHMRDGHKDDWPWIMLKTAISALGVDAVQEYLDAA